MSAADQLVSDWWEWVVPLTWQLALFVILVGVATWALRSASPWVRHTLWLLVLVKICLPTSMSAPWSVSNLIRGPIVSLEVVIPQPRPSLSDFLDDPPATRSAHAAAARWPDRLFMVWLLGAALSLIIVGVNYRRLCRMATALPAADEGPARIAVEQAALKLSVADAPDVHLSDHDSSPFLIGTVQPRIVLPRSMVEMPNCDLEAVMLHELVHLKHRDTWVGWIQVMVQSVLWFHPFVWFANARLRHERELMCDATVMQSGGVTPHAYGEILVRMLTMTRGRSFVVGSLVGVFERGSRIQHRLESVMQFEQKRSMSGWTGIATIGAFALMFLPLAPSLIDRDAHGAVAATKATAPADQKKVTPPKTPYPQIVKTEPAAGSTDVDPDIGEIRVTFDRDMGSGMSWTGGGKEYPPTDRSRKAHWIDKRTCVFPVRLLRGKYYRVGINSKSYRNFADAEGIPTPPSAIFFTTEGASRALENRVRIPRIIEMNPAHNADNVSPATRAIRVTFNMPMGDGMSWTGGGKTFPKIPEGHKPKWSADHRTCTLPVSLEPDHQYRLGLNSQSHNNFQSKWGVPIKPVIYEFQTSSGK